MSVVLGGPFNSGILAGDVKPGAKYDYADAARDRWIARRSASRRSAAATTCRSRPRRCSSRSDMPRSPVIPGATSSAELEQNIANMRRPIPPALWQELRHEKLLDPAAPVPAG